MEALLRVKSSYSCLNRHFATSLRAAIRRNFSDVSRTTDAAPKLPQQEPVRVATQPDVVNRVRKRWSFSALILFLPCAATFGLGTWQLFRWQWKIDVLNTRRSRLQQDPIPLVEALPSAQFKQILSPDSQNEQPLEFRTVYCEGEYDEKRSLYVGPRAKIINGVAQNGYYLVTPLLPTPSKEESSLFVQPPVLVNRGWVPSSWRDGARAAAPERSALDRAASSVSADEKESKEKQVTKRPWWNIFFRARNPGQDIGARAPSERVLGVVRGSEHPNMFVPSNVPETGQWFYVDVPAMAQAAGLPKNACYIEAMKSEGASMKKYPLAKDPDDLIHVAVMPQNHLNYALTWYSLSAATTFMAIKRLQKR